MVVPRAAVAATAAATAVWVATAVGASGSVASTAVDSVVEDHQVDSVELAATEVMVATEA